MNIDPLAEIAGDRTPYHFVSNNPINRVDPTGLTDYTINKDTGETTAVEGTKTEEGTDRILKLKKNGEIDYNKDGTAKYYKDNIKKGLLKDGHNFKKDRETFSVSEDLELDDILSFISNISGYFNKEIAGLTATKVGSEEISDVLLYNIHKENTRDYFKVPSSVVAMTRSTTISVNGEDRLLKELFHTHLTDPLVSKKETGDHHLGNYESGDIGVLVRIYKRNPNFLKTFVLVPPAIKRYYNRGGLED